MTGHSLASRRKAGEARGEGVAREWNRVGTGIQLGLTFSVAGLHNVATSGGVFAQLQVILLFADGSPVSPALCRFIIPEIQCECCDAKVVQHRHERTCIFFLQLIIPFHLIQDLLHRINFGDLQTGRWLMEDMVQIKGCSTIRQPLLNRQVFGE